MAQKTEPEIKITPLADIQRQAADRVVQLPGFTKDETFNAKLRRLSLLDLAESGSIPNELLGAVSQLYAKGVQGISSVQETAQAFHFIAQKALVAPTWQELKDAGITLTDEQLLDIYLYTVGGVERLKTFR